MSLIERLHGACVFPRRVQRLRDHLAALIPEDTQVLDVGSGDGMLVFLLAQRRPDIKIRGIDVLVRDRTHIQIDPFDGRVIPYGHASFDVVTFVDVLHHAEDPMGLLQEAVRVARKSIVIKDHTLDGLLAGTTLRFMDYIGNARHGVALPYHYWPRQKWLEACESLRLKIAVWTTDLGLYPWPANYLFDRSLHFVARFDLTKGR